MIHHTCLPAVMLFLASSHGKPSPGGGLACHSSDRVTVAGRYPEIEGCYQRCSDTEFLGRSIYTKDGENATEGSTIGIFGQNDKSSTDRGDNRAKWVIAILSPGGSGDNGGNGVSVENTLCSSHADWSATTSPGDDAETWECDSDLDGLYSTTEGVDVTCGCGGVDAYASDVSADPPPVPVPPSSVVTTAIQTKVSLPLDAVSDASSSSAHSPNEHSVTTDDSSEDDSKSLALKIGAYIVLALLGLVLICSIMCCLAKSSMTVKPKPQPKRRRQEPSKAPINRKLTRQKSATDISSPVVTFGQAAGLGLPRPNHVTRAPRSMGIR